MSINSKILLFAAVSLLATCTLGVALVIGAQVGKGIRERLVSVQEQLDELARLDDEARRYLNAIRQAREQGQDTGPIRREYEARVDAARARLQEMDVQPTFQALRPWIGKVEERLRGEQEGVPIPPTVHWELYQDYERTVGQLISSIHTKEWEERTRLRSKWNANVQRSLLIAKAVTAGWSVLIVVMALAILVPLRGALRKLRNSAERIGRGDFEVAVPPMGQDELGLLAHAMNRMVGELRDTLQEKQRLVKAEAEASEREARRYSAMLEETVRARTSELEESLRQLRSTQEQLFFADRLSAMGRLAAGVGHEINNPLSYMISNLRFLKGELTRMGVASAPEHQEMMEALEGVSEGAERVRVIVRDLKMLARVDGVDQAPLELEAVIRSATRFAEQEIRPRARMVVDCQNVPRVRGNEPRLVQVLLNLLINASQAIEPGRAEENEVRVVARVAEPGQVAVEVRDTGCGISPENLKRIFEPFFTTKPVGEGTGLGLSLCHSLISSQGGSIQVESQVGRGTTFRVLLAVA